MGFGNYGKPVSFNNPVVRNLRPDCVFTVKLVNPIADTDMNLVTVQLSCSGDDMNVLCSKNKQLSIGQKVEVIMVGYQHNAAINKTVAIIK